MYQERERQRENKNLRSWQGLGNSQVRMTNKSEKKEQMHTNKKKCRATKAELYLEIDNIRLQVSK